MSLEKDIPVLVICPKCGRDTMVPNLAILDETIHKMWQLFGQWGKKQFDENTVKDAIASAGIENNFEKLKQVFKEQGYIKVMCRTCVTDFTVDYYRKLGIPLLRIGNLAVDPDFYRKNRKWLKATIKEKGLDKVTFWT